MRSESGVTEDRPQRADAVAPSDLLPFAVGSARIADRHFENPRAALGQLDGQLGLDVKRGAFERNALQQPRPHHLVAGLHVGEVQVADQIAQESQQLVSQRMTEKKRALVPTGHENATRKPRRRPRTRNTSTIFSRSLG